MKTTSSNMCGAQPGLLPRFIRHDRICNNLLRIAMLIVFGLANLNNGLTSSHKVARDNSHNYNNNFNFNNNNISDTPHRNINQNLIMSSPSAAALTAASADVSYPPPPYPASSSSISASTTLFHHQNPLHSAHSSHSSPHPHQSQHQGSSSASGSSITSFDSTNVIDERQPQHQQQQHHRQQLQLAKDTMARPQHKVVGGGGGGGGSENHLDTNTSGEGGGGGGGSSSGATADDIYSAPMYFGTENSTIVTTQIGATAHIPCSVHHIGDGVVSWIRKKDYHLLTVGLTTYSSDERFSATHLKHSEDWTLQIKFVQLRDAGVYECQVSTHPPTSIFLHLNVVEARAEITGPPIRYLTPGSTLRLQCLVVQNTEASEFIFWYHDNRMINYDIDRGINVSTEPDFQSSELTILRTRREHSGNFTCVASNTQPASVLVHIFKGDNPAAMYHGHVGSSTKSYQTHLHCIMVIIAVGYRILHTHVHIKIV